MGDGRVSKKGPQPLPVRTQAESELTHEMMRVPDPDEVEARIAANHEKWQKRYAGRIDEPFTLLETITDGLLEREAEAARRSFPDEVERLMRKLSDGNLSPGLGSRHLFGAIHEARSQRGPRVYYKRSDHGVTVVAISTKATQDRVIDRLRELYAP